MESGKDKIVYKDGDYSKALFGKVIDEDNFFIYFKDESGDHFRIGKGTIILLKVANNG